MLQGPEDDRSQQRRLKKEGVIKCQEVKENEQLDLTK